MVCVNVYVSPVVQRVWGWGAVLGLYSLHQQQSNLVCKFLYPPCTAWLGCSLLDWLKRHMLAPWLVAAWGRNSAPPQANRVNAEKLGLTHNMWTWNAEWVGAGWDECCQSGELGRAWITWTNITNYKEMCRCVCLCLCVSCYICFMYFSLLPNLKKCQCHYAYKCTRFCNPHFKSLF